MPVEYIPGFADESSSWANVESAYVPSTMRAATSQRRSIDRTSSRGWKARVGPWLGYQYLGPGTDLEYKREHDIQPVDDLDAAARKHDNAYERIKMRYAAGDISFSEAQALTREADWALSRDAFLSYGKKLPALSHDIWKAATNESLSDAWSAVKAFAGAVPSALTGGAMAWKPVVDKLFGTASFTGISDIKPRRQTPFVKGWDRPRGVRGIARAPVVSLDVGVVARPGYRASRKGTRVRRRKRSVKDTTKQV